MSEKVVGTKLQEQAAQGSVLAKLIAFAVALAVVPIASYFISLIYLFDGNATYSAIAAIVAANIVLASYILASVLEDSSPSSNNISAHVGKQAEESRKSR